MEDITIRQAQQKVDEWINQHGVRYFNERTNMAVLTEEVGELAQALLDHKHGKCGFKHVQEEANQVAAMGLRFRIELARCL